MRMEIHSGFSLKAKHARRFLAQLSETVWNDATSPQGIALNVGLVNEAVLFSGKVWDDLADHERQFRFCGRRLTAGAFGSTTRLGETLW
jgi:hypothetical protein